MAANSIVFRAVPESLNKAIFKFRCDRERVKAEISLEIQAFRAKSFPICWDCGLRLFPAAEDMKFS